MAVTAPLALLLVGLAAIVWATTIVVENAIAVARYDGNTTEWSVVAHTTGTGGKDVYGSFGSSVIGTLVGTDAGGTVAGPALGSPMVDSRGNGVHARLTAITDKSTPSRISSSSTYGDTAPDGTYETSGEQDPSKFTPTRGGMDDHGALGTDKIEL